MRRKALELLLAPAHPLEQEGHEVPSKEQIKRRLRDCEEAYAQSRSPAALAEALELAATGGTAPRWLLAAAAAEFRDALVPRAPKPRRGPASALSRLKNDLRRLYRAGVADSAQADLGLSWADARAFAAWYLSTPGHLVTETTIRHDIEEVRRWHRETPGRARLFAIESIAPLIPRVQAPHSARTWLEEHRPKRRDRVGPEWRPLTPFVMRWSLPETD